MTLDEAIKHAEEVAEENQRVVDTGIVFDDVTIDMLYCDDTEVIEKHLANYQSCADEHRQLAEWLKDYKRLLEQDPCEDAISRKAVYEQINCWIGSGEYRYTNATDYLIKRIADLQSIQQKPKTGHWIYSKAVNTGEIIFSECSACGHGESRCAKRMNYCPSCGAKMAESEGTDATG